jgi:signal transduction histidine kinase
VSLAPTTTGTFSAVIVDDTPDLRLLLRITLEQDGDFEVVAEAENGLEGVRRVEELQPDLVLLDLAMPVMDGLEALPQIRAVCPRARVVVLSGFEADTMAQRVMGAGADGYLQKGTTPRRILSFVRRVVAGADAAPPRDTGPSVLETAAPTPAIPPAQSEPTGSQAERAAALAAVGLVLVHTGSGPGDDAVLGFANETAARALGIAPGADGKLLAEVAPRLQALLVRRLADVRAGRETRERTSGPGGTFDVVMRASGADEVVVTLLPAARSDEATVLRQAISTTAHEIRNPVTLLSGVAAVVSSSRDALPPDQLERLLGAVGRQSLILERLTDDLLTAAQAGRGSLRVDVRPVALDEVVTDALRDVRDLGEVEVGGEQGLTVLADPDRLHQMVANLLSNAVKYGERPFAVTVRSGDPRGFAHVDVSDSGAGVPESFRAHLFDEFTRAEDARARGTGIGLFVVRSLAEAQGGRADYRPREGGGSVFTVTLPLAVEQSAQTGRPDSV